MMQGQTEVNDDDVVRHELRPIHDPMGTESVEQSVRMPSGDPTTKRLAEMNRTIGEVSSNYFQHGKFHASDNSNVHLGDIYTVNNFLSSQRVPSSILKSLNFPQINNRIRQVQDASPKTYQWLLASEKDSPGHASAFRTWLEDAHDHRVFWIAGKPGSGKSTLMKLISEDVEIDRLLSIGRTDSNIVRLNHFFWSSGNTLQRSIEGLLRNLLVQILRHYPVLRANVEAILHSSEFTDDSTSLPIQSLQTSILALIREPLSSSMLFIAIDGLDECGSSLKDQETVLGVISQLSQLQNTKVCTSSRPYNKFRDGFQSCPQIRLEYLTSGDIVQYITSELEGCVRWRILSSMRAKAAQDLLDQIASRAQGVFLWVSLVVRDLSQALEDGGDLSDLRKILVDVPEDLEGYFTSILNSIEARMRSQASVLLQSAVYKEDHFTALYAFNIMDVICLQQANLHASPDGLRLREETDLMHEDRMRWQVDSALRTLSSRCKGLLECVETSFRDWEWDHDSKEAYEAWKQYHPADNSTQRFSQYIKWLATATNTPIQPLHRSLADFLRLPSTQELLIRYNGGRPHDVRSELIKARTVQLGALVLVKAQADEAVGLASYLMSALSVQGNDSITSYRASVLADMIEQLPKESADGYWYLQRSFDRWQDEQSNFVSLAIDFRLTSYVLKHMTSSVIAQKHGRPILDYILRPRFAQYSHTKIFKSYPDLDMLHAALQRGADPNQALEEDGETIWAKFLRYLKNVVLASRKLSIDAKHAWYQATKSLLEAGAAQQLPQRWLRKAYRIEAFRESDYFVTRSADLHSDVQTYMEVQQEARLSSLSEMLCPVEDAFPSGSLQELCRKY